jgi:hypothetical protein
MIAHSHAPPRPASVAAPLAASILSPSSLKPHVSRALMKRELPLLPRLTTTAPVAGFPNSGAASSTSSPAAPVSSPVLTTSDTSSSAPLPAEASGLHAGASSVPRRASLPRWEQRSSTLPPACVARVRINNRERSHGRKQRFAGGFSG